MDPEFRIFHVDLAGEIEPDSPHRCVDPNPHSCALLKVHIIDTIKGIPNIVEPSNPE